MTPTSGTSLSEGQGRQLSLRAQRLTIGAIAIVLSLTSMELMAGSAPWQIRFPFVAAAVLFGPAIPALRLRPELSLEQCLVYGIGVNVALQMLTGLTLVLWHAWEPVAASLGLLTISLAAGLKLLYDARK